MKLKHNLLTVLFVGILAMATLPSCSVLQPKSVAVLKLPSTLSEAGKQAQSIIVEVNIDLTAAYQVLGENTKNDSIPPTDAAKYLALLNDYSVKADQAQGALLFGDIADAKSQAEALQTLVAALHKTLADKAKGN